MKKLGAFAIGILVVFPLAILAQDEGYYDRSYARMSYIKGDVSVQRASDQGFEQGEVNLPLVQGDKLGTRDGRAEIQFGKSNYLRIDANTQLDFKGLPQRDGDATSLHLLAGRIYLRVAFLDREKAFEIHTPDGSFYVLDQGLYRFEVSQSRETEVFVLDGSLEAAGQEGSVQVGRNERLTAVNGDLRSPSSDYIVTRDDFAEWNADRDELHKPRASTRYLPEEINEYQDELDANGHWTYERPYGYVWVPYISDSDWRPYYNGRWVWYPIIGWTWVSYESWGWCAYHYGRWHWRLGLGWYWIPTHHWGPAWVHWWSDYNYYGWCPLGWHNSPIVVINNYFYDRYDHRDYPLNSRALTVVHRNQLQSRQIARDALSSDRIKLVNKVSLRAQQPDIKPIVNRASLDQRIGEKILSRQDIRGVRKSFSPGGIRLDRPQLVNDVRGKGTVDSFDKTAIRERSLNSGPRDIRDSGRTGTPRLLNKEGIKSYPSRTSPSSLRSDLSPRADESREPRASSDALGGLLRTFRSRISESGTRSGERDSIDRTSPRTRSYNDGERRPEVRSNRDSDGPSYSRSYSSPSRESSSSSSSNRPSYSPRARESSPSSSSSRSSYSPRSSSGSRSYSSPSRSSGSSSRSVSSGRIHKK